MDIRRLRYRQIRLKKLFKDKTGTHETSPHLYRLPFRRSPKEEYTFENGAILLNEIDVLTFLEDAKLDVGFLANLAQALSEYRHVVWSQYGTDWRDFNGKAQGILDRILNKLTHVYEEMTGGLRVQFNGGRLWINDIDPKVVLALFLSNPNEERRRYLMSIQTKLGLILEGKIARPSSHGVLEEAKRIYHQIQTALENAPSASSPPLLANVLHLDR